MRLWPPNQNVWRCKAQIKAEDEGITFATCMFSAAPGININPIPMTIGGSENWIALCFSPDEEHPPCFHWSRCWHGEIRDPSKHQQAMTPSCPREEEEGTRADLVNFRSCSAPVWSDSRLEWEYRSTLTGQTWGMTSCGTTAAWLGMNNNRSVLDHPTFLSLSRTSATADHSLSHILPRFSGVFTEAWHPTAYDITGLWVLRVALFEKTSSTGGGKNHPGVFFFFLLLLVFFPFSIPRRSVGQVPPYDSRTSLLLLLLLLQRRHTWNDARRRWNGFL